MPSGFPPPLFRRLVVGFDVGSMSMRRSLEPSGYRCRSAQFSSHFPLGLTRGRLRGYPVGVFGGIDVDLSQFYAFGPGRISTVASDLGRMARFGGRRRSPRGRPPGSQAFGVGPGGVSGPFPVTKPPLSIRFGSIRVTVRFW